jgi:hypothetical protein
MKTNTEISQKDTQLLNKIVIDLQRVKNLNDKADIEFFLKLRDISIKHKELIERGHGSVFSFFSSKGLSPAPQFKSFLRGLSFIDDPTAKKVGLSVVMALAKTQHKKQVHEVVRLALEHFSAHSVQPNDRQAKAIMMTAGAREIIARGPTIASQLQRRISQLEAENEQLRADLRSERRLKVQFERRLAQYEKSGKRAA